MHEQEARNQEDERREPEREGRDHAEREVDRRADGAVRGGEQARRAQPPLDRDERVPARPARGIVLSHGRPVHPRRLKHRRRRAQADAGGARPRGALRLAQRPRRCGVDDHPAGALARARSRASCSGACPTGGGPASASRSRPSARRSPRARSGGRPRPAAPSRSGRARAGRGRPTGGQPRSPPARLPPLPAEARRCRDAAAP